jgi:hypothetical protein
LRKLQFLEYRRNEGTEKIEKIVEIENIEELENLVLFSSLPIDVNFVEFRSISLK